MTQTEIPRINQYIDFMKEKKSIPAAKLAAIDFFITPASKKFHGNYEGGLFDHSLATAKALVDLTEKLGLKWQRKDSPYIVGMYHDLCKCGLYIVDKEGQYQNNPDILMPDHGAASIITTQKYMRLTDEEIACIRWHMGSYEKDYTLWNYYNRAVAKYPNVLYTHVADMIASHIEGV